MTFKLRFFVINASKVRLGVKVTLNFITSKENHSDYGIQVKGNCPSKGKKYQSGLL